MSHIFSSWALDVNLSHEIKIQCVTTVGHTDLNTNISHGSVVTHLRCGGIFKDDFIAKY